MSLSARRYIPWILALSSFVLGLALVEFISWAWPAMTPPQIKKSGTPFFSWSEVASLAQKDSGRNGIIARELVKMGVLNYESRPVKRDFSLLKEVTDFEGLKNAYEKNADGEIVLRGHQSKREKVRYRVTMDALGRRKAGHFHSPEKENIVFLGCSFTFGDGLNVIDTIPFIMAEEMPVNTFNLGVSGGTATDSFVKMKEHGKEILGDLNAKPVTVVYTFIDDQLRRTIGTSKWLATPAMMMKGHQIYLKGDELHYYPRKDAGVKDLLWLRGLFGKSQFAKKFSIEIPSIGEDELALFARTIRGVKEEAAKFMSMKSFLFVFYPGQDFYAPRLKPLLLKNGIAVLDLSDVPPFLLNGRELLTANPHPSGLMNRIFARLLSLELGKASGYP